MTKIEALHGLRFNPKKVGDLAAVMAPPYDVIDPELQEKLYERSPYNVVRIDLAKEEAGLDRYAAAQRRFSEWKENRILVREEQPSIYLYFQTYSLPDGRRLTRRGFIARRRLESFAEGGVKPHEQTFPGPKADRLQLMRATHAGFSPIFSLFSDPQQEVGGQLAELSQKEPDIQILDDHGDEHRLWKIDDAAAISRLLDLVRDRSLLIADGHHRYETALAFAEEQKAKLGVSYTGKEAFNYIMMFFCALEDPGLVVLPTHRVLAQRPEVEEDLFRRLLEKFARIETFRVGEFQTALARLEQAGERGHALAWVYGGKIEVLSFDAERLLQSESLNHLHFVIRDLDVTILHDLLFAELLGISKGAQKEYGNILYVKEAAEVLRLAEAKQSYGFLMNATKLKQIEAVIAIGEKMPQKSTFFYPKPLTGLVLYDFS
ncbi:MAG TPA: DUF1015 domain-containing protein [Deltaproteobacteria bacterium]|nr:DUF1015 domain-containing protein [Deltaproteobacteria bacterium]